MSTPVESGGEPHSPMDDQREPASNRVREVSELSTESATLDDVLRATESRNPFLNRTRKITVYEGLKLVLMFPVLLVRVLLLALVVIPAIYVVCMVATCGHSTIEDARTGDILPISACRRCLLLPMQWLVRVLLWLLGYLYIHEKGCCPHLCGPEAPVIVANHVGFIEPAFLFYKFLPCCIGQKGLLEAPCFGTIFSAITPIAVDRDSADGRSRAGLNCYLRPSSGFPVRPSEWEELDRQQAELESTPLEQRSNRWAWKQKETQYKRVALERRDKVSKGEESPYPPLLVFPEGTTHNDETLMQFKKGAFISGQPVLPVVVRYPYCHFEASWTNDMPVWVIIWRLLSQVYNVMIVEYLPIHVPTDEEKADPMLYANNVRLEMAAALGAKVELTDHCYEDARLLSAAQRAYDSELKGLEVTNDITFHGLEQAFHLQVSQVSKLIEQFHAIDLNQDGVISRDEFAAALNLDVDSHFTTNLFRVLDHEGTDSFDFRTMLQGLVLVSGRIPEDQKLELIFTVYDSNGNGLVGAHELMDIIQRKPSTVDRQTGLRRTSTSDEASRLVYQVLGGKETINLEEFKQRSREHPELLHYAIGDLSKLFAPKNSQQQTELDQL